MFAKIATRSTREAKNTRNDKEQGSTQNRRLNCCVQIKSTIYTTKKSE